MSEPIWCSVRFKVPASWNGPMVVSPFDTHRTPTPDRPTEMIPTPPWFVTDAAEALINGTGPDGEVETGPGDMAGDGWTIWNVNGEGNYGLNDDDLAGVLDWCCTQRVPYYATSDPKYEMAGEIDFFDGDVHRNGECGSDGEPKLAYALWLQAKEHADPLACVEAYFDLLTLPPFEEVDISHLPAKYPPRFDDDEEE